MEQVKSSAKGISIAALISGALSVVTFILMLAGASLGNVTMLIVIGIVFGILGIIFGAVGMSKSKKAGESKALALVGLILGILGIVLIVALIVVGCFVGVAALGALSSY